MWMSTDKNKKKDKLSRRHFLGTVGVFTGFLTSGSLGRKEDKCYLREKSEPVVSAETVAQHPDKARDLLESIGRTSSPSEQRVFPSYWVRLPNNLDEYINSSNIGLRKYASDIDRNFMPDEHSFFDFSPKLPEYVEDKLYGPEQLKTSEEFLEDGGDCEDYAFTVGSILNLASKDFKNIRPLFGVTKVEGEWQYHAALGFEYKLRPYITDTMMDNRRGEYRSLQNYKEEAIEDMEIIAFLNEDGETEVWRDGSAP